MIRSSLTDPWPEAPEPRRTGRPAPFRRIVRAVSGRPAQP
ncbi:Hypothetical protein SCLAV_1954 [Streptomyces clavuligerus]|uniref:Uncharacterized protein n=1 Tax=Streptomyces clavuligerus TaxID=1901 RepID=E2Q4I9_STRCL|nr:Hypothetical protein SCLAV_1954 [Streptomyces clavuligerus]